MLGTSSGEKTLQMPRPLAVPAHSRNQQLRLLGFKERAQLAYYRRKEKCLLSLKIQALPAHLQRKLEQMFAHCQNKVISVQWQKKGNAIQAKKEGKHLCNSQKRSMFVPCLEEGHFFVSTNKKRDLPNIL